MNIFALGDCNNSAETKLGFLARAQAEVRVCTHTPASEQYRPHLTPAVPDYVSVFSLGQALPL